MAIDRFYKIVTPASARTIVSDNKDISGHSSYTNTSWYHNLVYGAAQRISKYSEYDSMDTDIDVARALDVIAEEITGNNPKGNLPLVLKITDGIENRVTNTHAVTVKAALKTWCKIQDWENRIFSTARNLVKYGDCFFLRPKKIGKRYQYVHPRNVTGAVVSETDITDIKQWEIQNDVKNTNGGLMSTNYAGLFGNDAPGGSMAGTIRVDYENVVWFTLYNDMAEEAPFGVSILKSIFRTFKQKELLEDAIIIYRIQRAPERRVFYIDVGKTPAHLIPSHLEQLKNEIRQKKIPSSGGGKGQVDSIYNPQSMNEDFFFATNGTTGGNRVETLPSGQNLGELADLDYFYKKLWRGLRIPESYMNNAADGSSPATDGKVGIAYQQEIKFTLYIERLQKALEKTLDEEFKRFLHDCKIKVDHSTFEIVLPTPSSYKESREQSVNADLLGNFSMTDGIDFISPRFAAKKYLGWSQEEILLNERMKREELGLTPDGGIKDLAVIYNPDRAEAGGLDGGMGGGSGSGGKGDDFFLGDETGGDETGLGDKDKTDTKDDKGAPDEKKPAGKAPEDK
jgi:hypothetical protein